MTSFSSKTAEDFLDFFYEDSVKKSQNSHSGFTEKIPNFELEDCRGSIDRQNSLSTIFRRVLQGPRQL